MLKCVYHGTKVSPNNLNTHHRLHDSVCCAGGGHHRVGVLDSLLPRTNVSVYVCVWGGGVCLRMHLCICLCVYKCTCMRCPTVCACVCVFTTTDNIGIKVRTYVSPSPTHHLPNSHYGLQVCLLTHHYTLPGTSTHITWVQWNLSKTTTFWPVLTDLYREVAALQR